MLDVKIVIFDVRENRTREAQFLLENRPHILIQKLGVFLGNAIALSGHFRSWPLDRNAFFDLGDVISQIPERNFQVLNPILIRRIEPVARGKIEPRILRGVPGFEPLLALSVSRDRGKSLLTEPFISASSTPVSTARRASFFNSSSGRNRSTSTPWTIRAIA